jgi:HK97 family phage major capsid protein
MDVKNTLQSGVDADGGHLVPVVDDTSVIKLREANDALQNIVRVVKITKPEGKKTVQKRHGNGTNFAQVDEAAGIPTGGTPKFYKMAYNAKKYAAIYDITDEEFSDADENVISIMNEWIGNDSRCNRNNLILGALDLLPKTAITGLDDIKTVLNKTLRKASLRFSTVITNQSGYNWLDQLKDADGKPLLQPDPKDADRYLLKGKKVDVYDDEILPNYNDGVNDFAPVVIGDMDNVVLFDREDVSVKITDVGGDAFATDKILMRAIEREDVQLLCDTVDELARDIVYGRVNLGA